MKVVQLGKVIVKATRFLQPEQIEVDSDGIRHDRAFALVEADDKFIGSSEHSEFIPLRFTLDDNTDSLTLEMPDGTHVEGPAAGDGRKFDIDHFGLRTINVAEVEGPWEAALSDYAGRKIRLVRCLTAQRSIDVFPVTFLTTGSLDRLASEVGESMDAARFRAGFVLEHDNAHEEDGWDGRHLRVGSVLFRVRTAVPRCQVTGYNPVNGKSDQAVMKALIKYREKVHLPDGMMPDYATPGFATYTEVVEPGVIAVGDAASLVD